MIAIISIKAANITVILRESRDMCVSPFLQTNSQTLKIRIYNDTETSFAVNGLVIIRLPSQG